MKKGLVQELLDQGKGPIAFQNSVARDVLTRSYLGLGVTGDGQPAEEGKTEFNTLNLSSSCPPLQLSKPYTLVSGNGTFVQADKTSDIGEDAMFHGVSFSTVEDKPNIAALKIAADKRAIFVGCTFHRFESMNTTEIVTVEDGGQAIFIGCLFVGGTLGVKNLGGAPDAGNVILIGCSKREMVIFGDHVTLVNCLS